MRLSKLEGSNHSVYQNGVRLKLSQHDEHATVLKRIKTGHNIKFFEIKHKILYVKQKETIFQNQLPLKKIQKPSGSTFDLTQRKLIRHLKLYLMNLRLMTKHTLILKILPVNLMNILHLSVTISVHIAIP